MKYAIDASYRTGNGGCVVQIDFDEIDLIAHFAQVFKPACREIVEYAHLQPTLDEGIDQMRADESCSTGNENFAHNHYSLK